MLMVIPKGERRSRLLAYSCGRRTALRSTASVLDQVQDTLARERQKHAEQVAVLANKLTEVSLELRDLGSVHREVVQQNLLAALAAAPSPSAMMH